VIAGFAGVGSVISDETGLYTVGIVFAISLSSMLADGFSMASSNFLSSRAEIKLEESTGEEKRDCDDEQNKTSPIRDASFTFLSFIIFGSIPLSPYFFLSGASNLFLISAIFSLIMFILIGLLRARITGEKIFKTLIEVVGVGAIAATIAYFVGLFVSTI